MKVAIPIFRNGVSPRIDIADSLLIYDIDNGKIKKKKKCSLTYEHSAQLISILRNKQITRVICSGCPQFFLRMLCLYGVKVIPGVVGNPDTIIKQMMNGEISDITADGLKMRSSRSRSRYGGRGRGKKGITQGKEGKE